MAKSKSSWAKRRSGRRSSRTPSDLGAVPFSTQLRCTARKRRPQSGASVPTPALAGGILADLQDAHARGFKGSWELGFGSVSLSLKTHQDLDCLEEFWVLLMELVDAGYGEWTLLDGDDALIIEAQVFGPDVQLEFGCENGAPRFRGRSLPRKATLRLRALIEEGVGIIRQLLEQAGRLDPAFVEREEVTLLVQDLDTVVGAVADLPREFRSKETG